MSLFSFNCKKITTTIARDHSIAIFTILFLFFKIRIHTFKFYINNE